MFQSKYNMAQEYYKKALAIRMEISDRAGGAADYGNLGTVSRSLGNYNQAQEYHEKALAIRMEVGDSRRSSGLRKPRNSVPIPW